jgi:hypothetical protein
MSNKVDIRKAIRWAIDEALSKPVKGKSLREVLEKAVERAIRMERAKLGPKEKVEGSPDSANRTGRLSSCQSLVSADTTDEPLDAEVKSKYIN